MKKYIIIIIALVFNLKLQAQNCGQIDTSFCPGNFFQNGDFESITRSPNGDDNINLATGWSKIWGTGSLADLSCGDRTIGTGTNPPTPNQGVYSGMWIQNSNGVNTDSDFREGMYNFLASPISFGSGEYTFNFDIASAGNTFPSDNYSGPSVNIGFYGVYNLNSIDAPAPNKHNVPDNLNLWGTNSGVKVVHLGSISSPNSFTNSWVPQTLTFNSNLLPTEGITHILITKDDAQVESFRKCYVLFDNFCLAPAAPEEPVTCCETKLGIANPPNTPSPLPVKNIVNNGIDFSLATETFQIHDNAAIPITEIKVSVIDLIYKYNYESCGECVNNPALWGSLMSQSVIGEKGLYPTAQDYTTSDMISANQNVRELVWANPDGALLKLGDTFDVNYILPPASEIPCCVTEVQVCTQISWKDANCCVNEIKTCSTIKLEREQTSDTDSGNTPSTCDCGKQYPIVNISDNNSGGSGSIQAPKSVKCSSFVNLDLFKRYNRSSKVRYTFDHPGDGICEPESCSSVESWKITDEKGRLVEQGIGNINFFEFPSRGKYTISFTPSCGGNDCSSCVFEVNVN